MNVRMLKPTRWFDRVLRVGDEVEIDGAIADRWIGKGIAVEVQILKKVQDDEGGGTGDDEGDAGNGSNESNKSDGKDEKQGDATGDGGKEEKPAGKESSRKKGGPKVNAVIRRQEKRVQGE